MVYYANFLMKIIVSIYIGTNWKIISGHKEGQTQVDSPSYDNRTWWCHPIDIHFTSKGIQGNISLSFLMAEKFNKYFFI